MCTINTLSFSELKITLNLSAIMVRLIIFVIDFSLNQCVLRCGILHIFIEMNSPPFIPSSKILFASLKFDSY